MKTSSMWRHGWLNVSETFESYKSNNYKQFEIESCIASWKMEGGAQKHLLTNASVPSDDVVEAAKQFSN